MVGIAIPRPEGAIPRKGLDAGLTARLLASAEASPHGGAVWSPASDAKKGCLTSMPGSSADADLLNRAGRDCAAAQVRTDASRAGCESSLGVKIGERRTPVTGPLAYQ